MQKNKDFTGLCQAMLAEVGRGGVAPTVFLMYLIKSQVLKCRPRLTIPIKKKQARANTGLLHIIVI